MELYEPEHIVAVLATGGLAALAVHAGRTLSPPQVVWICRALALLIALAYAADHAFAVARDDWSTQRYLPFHLTDAVTILAVIALWLPRALPVELVYFWALTASLQAVLTPDLGEGFPDLYFWTYFVTHSGAVVAACLLVFGRRLRPRAGAVRRAVLATLAVAAIAAVANLATGGNYMFLREKPGSGSLLDLLGPWPVYILVAGGVAVALFAALAAPFRGASRRAGEPGKESN
ncbi:MAG: TIGR02206 family membrane protein [Solirubrobacterales bacterium]